jgi:hypothetical protein
MTRIRTAQETNAALSSAALSSVYVGHEARDGFCPVCGSVAPCYRARRASAQLAAA